MSLDSILGTAASGLAVIDRHLAVVSQNVANAGTAGYARQVVADSDLNAGGLGFGVRSGPTTQAVDAALSDALDRESANASGLEVRSAALATIDAVQGKTGAGEDLASRVGALRDAFTALGADPANQANQAAIVTAANVLAGGVRVQASAYATARQGAQDGLVRDVSALNAAVAAIGSISDRIIAAMARGESTADLEVQRTVQEQAASALAGLRFLPVVNGDVTVVAGGAIVNTRGTVGPFSVAPANLGPGSVAPTVLLSGLSAAGQLGGAVGARIALRDTEVPQLQAGLDEFAKTLASRLDSQGLRLFTDPAGNPPALGGSPVQAGYIGFSTTLTVNPVVASQPNLVRDGTQTVAPGTGGASGFTPNPPGGPAGATVLIDRILQYGFGAQAQPGVPQPAPASTGLGANGASSIPYAPSATLQDFAADLAGHQAQAAGAAQDALTTGQAVQATLQSKLAGETGVSVDTELSHMIVLQNAYGANAKIITAVQSMWTSLFNAVTP